jgi:hypothetical protein
MSTDYVTDGHVARGVERKWGRRGKIIGLVALEGCPDEMDDQA